MARKLCAINIDADVIARVDELAKHYSELHGGQLNIKRAPVFRTLLEVGLKAEFERLGLTMTAAANEPPDESA